MSATEILSGNNTAQDEPESIETPLCTFDTEHEGQIHDCQVDLFGKRVATCSSDNTIKIFNLENNNLKHVATLKGHKGPVWQVKWAFPSFGTLLASCSIDGTVKIWSNEGNIWWVAWENLYHSVSVNSIAWAPPECDLMLASACSDGTVCISKCRGKTWEVGSFYAHDTACYSVAWAPSRTASRQFSPNTYSDNTKMMLATGGCDNLIKIWENDNGQWINKSTLKGHRGWVRDLNFSPITGTDTIYLASCSDDKFVFIWKKRDGEDNWNVVNLDPNMFPDTVWRVSWSQYGNMLSISYGDGYVSIWKEILDGSWVKIQKNC